MLKKLKEIVSQLQPKSFILIFLSIAALIVLSLVFEYYQRSKEFTKLMRNQTHALLETTDIALKNALLTGREVETQLSSRLLNNAVLIKLLLEDGKVNNTLLKKIADENDILRINIFSKDGTKRFSSHPTPFETQSSNSIYDRLYPIFEGLTDTLIIGLREAKINNQFRYVTALATEDNGAIVLVLDGDKILNFRRKIGFGALLKNLTEDSKLIYAVLQDSSGFIAASGKFKDLENIEDSEFLTNSISSNSINWRIFETDSINVFEAVQVFKPGNRIIGLLRIGVSTEDFSALNKRFITRLFISGAILILLGFIVIAFIFTSQSNLILKKQYRKIETYSTKVLLNINDSIIVCNNNYDIVSINKKGEAIFNPSIAIGKNIFTLISDPSLKSLSELNEKHIQITLYKNNNKYIYEVSLSSFIDENNLKNYIFVFTDLTEQKQLEEKINRQDRLSAMGELAGGVAHEIRNPLNTIGTIAQQLHKDFEPKTNNEDYFNLTKLIVKEVKRINQTISDFLKFARPEPIVKSTFGIEEIFNQLKEQYKEFFNQKNIKFIHNLNENCIVFWDKNKILQALMNILQNSYDAINDEGEITFDILCKNNDVQITISDTGEGIPPEKLNKIFNLYYTTKAKGTGIGLSITQRIIYEHDGLISISSKIKNGTIVTIVLPKGKK